MSKVVINYSSGRRYCRPRCCDQSCDKLLELISFNLIAIFCLSKITITSRRHDVIRRRLDALAARASSADTDQRKSNTLSGISHEPKYAR